MRRRRARRPLMSGGGTVRMRSKRPGLTRARSSTRASVRDAITWSVSAMRATDLGSNRGEGTIGRRDHEDALVLCEAIHLDEHRVERLRVRRAALVGATAANR
eukprot:4511344-Prymnesium_polylepis.1